MKNSLWIFVIILTGASSYAQAGDVSNVQSGLSEVEFSLAKDKYLQLSKTDITFHSGKPFSIG
jgi:hypothetical protein